MARQYAAMVIASILVGVVAACGWVSDGTDSYRPPDAPIAAKASCVLPDIVDRLDGGNSLFDAPKKGQGSVPAGFKPTSVISCQSREGNNGEISIDEVTLSGDVDALMKALSRTSEQADKNTSVTCGVQTYPPAAIWLVSSVGAVRAQWPSVVCNLRDDPLAPLEALTEIRRISVQSIGVPQTADCRGPTWIYHTTKSGEGGGDAPAFTRRPTMRLPEKSVANLTACTYRYTRLPNGEVYNDLLIGRTTLTTEASTRLVREVIAAPEAQPCDRDATGVVSVTLYRPDGSGGGVLSMETDGCQRVVINDLTNYRSTTSDLIALLRR